jgi:tetratricopeptide (TPR) repeat protein
MVDLLSATLDGAGDLHSVDPRAVLAVTAHASAPDPRAIARQLGAGNYIIGNIVGNAGRVSIQATLYDGTSGTKIVSASTQGDTSKVFDLVDNLAGQLLAGRVSGPSARITHLASVTTSSLPALKRYLEGETSLRKNDFAPAVESFKAAIDSDPSFALAYFRLSIADEWLTHTVDAALTAQQAVQHSDHLSAHDRQLLAGLNAARQGNVPEAERLYTTLLATYPDDYEAWWQLGELKFHDAPIYGEPVADAAPAFRHVLALDPRSEPALIHLARIAAHTHNRAAADSLIARSLDAAPANDRSYEMRIDRAILDGDSATFKSLVAELHQAPDFAAFLPAWSLVEYVQDFDAARAVYLQLADPARSPDVQARGVVLIAALDVLHGQLAAADSEIARVASLSTPWANEYRALIAALPYLPVDSARARAARAALDKWDAAATPDVPLPDVEFSADNGLHAMIQQYLIGILDANLGDSASAERAAKAIVALPAARDHRPLAETLDSAVTHELTWRPGHSPTAVEPRVVEFYEWLIGSPFRSQARERFRYAQTLAAAGQDTAAIRWFSSFETAATDDALYLAPSYLARARLYAKLGDRPHASAHYHTFITLWQHCDPALHPLVAQAQHELSTLP